MTSPCKRARALKSSGVSYRWRGRLLLLLPFLVLGASASGLTTTEEQQRGSGSIPYATNRGESCFSQVGLVTPPLPLLVCPLAQQQERWEEGEGKDTAAGETCAGLEAEPVFGDERPCSEGSRRNGTSSTPPRGSPEPKNDHDDDELEEGQWIKGSVCHERIIPGQEQQLFCTYTQPSFRGGFGISIITTAENFERMLELGLPTLQSDDDKTKEEETGRNLRDDDAGDHCHHHDDPRPKSENSETRRRRRHQHEPRKAQDPNKAPGPCPSPAPPPLAAPSSSSPYKVVPVPGKGLGVLATRPVAANEVYMARTPAVMVDDAAVQGLGVARLTALLVQVVEALPGPHREEVLGLTTSQDDDDGGGASSGGREWTKGERVHAIFEKNNFLTNVEGVGGFHSIFTQVSRLNHACRPNSEYVFDSATFTHKIFAARDIDAGEELTLTYHDPFQTHANRQSSLLHHWGFQCTCALCTASAAEIERSDERIKHIQALWSVLDHYAPPPPPPPPPPPSPPHSSSSSSSATTTTTTEEERRAAATPEDAELLIRLYREEGLHTRMVEAYYRAAVEWNGRGDAERAVHFAGRAVEAGSVMESGIRPFLDNMRALARDPRGHWTWMFRVPT